MADQLGGRCCFVLEVKGDTSTRGDTSYCDGYKRSQKTQQKNQDYSGHIILEWTRCLTMEDDVAR